ncbi:carboxypeptidase regulatory-like domain-containing protein [Sphingobacterium corticis]|uniref:Carboxypeptidase regulatory-like domain-containing protein n=1 Tax=Sphingobacterium corticis TaxID=1812823 RepID=A0ABW5NIH4_9SPHI
MKSKISFYLTVFLFSVSILSFAQQKPTVPINDVVEKVQGYFGVYPVEKVHLHFDKPYYAVGDTLWFKSYLNYNLGNYDPSKIVYVEVLNSRDSLIQTLRVQMKNGVGKGQLVLDQEFWKQDNYRFRAYTKWMVNFNQDYFYNKVVPIGDAINKKLGAIVNFTPDGNKTKATLQFRDKSGAILSRKKLNWEANDGWDQFDKGRAETDDMGRVSISLSAKNKELMKTGRLLIQIDNNEEKLVGQYSLSSAIWDVDVQFFPEGGDLISGLAKNVAFKALSNDGKGAKVKGKVIDGKKNEVASFADLGMGMGYFSFIPQSGESYKAIVTFDNGQEKTYDLPAVVDEAVNLVSLPADDTHMQLGIVTSDNHYKKLENSAFYVFGQSNGHLVYAAQIAMKNSSVLVKVPRENMPNGVVQFTLFTTDGTPVSERLVFCNSTTEDLLDIAVSSDKDSYRSKDPVKLKVALKNGTDSVASSYSVTVVDETKVPYDDDQELGILSNLLLTSDLQGFVEKPNYYFNPKHENRAEALEALLMTQGFSRFDYKKLLKAEYPQVMFMPEQGISVSGTLRMNNGRTQPNGGLLLSIPALGMRKDTYTDQQGRFSFDELVFPDSAQVTVSARGNDNFRSLVINMDQTHFPEIDANSPFKGSFIQNIDEQLNPYLANSKKEFRTSIVIDEVQVNRTVVKKQSSRDFGSLSGLNMPEHRIEADRITGCNVLTMCLNTLLTGITYDNNTLKYYVSRNYNQGSRVPVQFFLNGMPIDEPSLNSIQPAEIEAIEIFLRDELGTVSRTYQNDGVVSIITKKDDTPKRPRMSLAEIEAILPKTNIVDLYPLGYVKTRTFYTPKYDTPQSKNTSDFRSTIYWNPDVLIDGSGEMTLDYFNGDGNGRYKVIVEGMDRMGSVGRQVYYYQVK